MSIVSDVTRSAGDNSTVALDDVEPIVVFLRQMKAQQDYFAKRRKEAEVEIKERLGDAETGTIAGRPVVTYRTTERIAVSHKLLVQQYPAIALECQDINEVRTFKLLD